MFKLLVIIIFIAFPMFAKEYICNVDTVKYLDSNKFVSIQKDYRLNVLLNLTPKNIVYLKVGSDIEYTLKYVESKKISGFLDADIYIKDNVQLEIIDISESWEVGARLFYKNRMLVIGSCNH